MSRHYLTCYLFLLYLRFSMKGAESTTRLQRWSEASSGEWSCFTQGSNPDWSWNCDRTRVLTAGWQPSRPLWPLLRHTCIPLWLSYCIATAVKQSSVCFYNEKHCTEFFKKTMKCFQVTLSVIEIICESLEEWGSLIHSVFWNRFNANSGRQCWSSGPPLWLKCFNNCQHSWFPDNKS